MMRFLCLETEAVGLAHCELGKKLNDLVDKTSKFREIQKSERVKVLHLSWTEKV